MKDSLCLKTKCWKLTHLTGLLYWRHARFLSHSSTSGFQLIFISGVQKSPLHESLSENAFSFLISRPLASLVRDAESAEKNLREIFMPYCAAPGMIVTVKIEFSHPSEHSERVANFIFSFIYWGDEYLRHESLGDKITPTIEVSFPYSSGLSLERCHSIICLSPISTLSMKV